MAGPRPARRCGTIARLRPALIGVVAGIALLAGCARQAPERAAPAGAILATTTVRPLTVPASETAAPSATRASTQPALSSPSPTWGPSISPARRPSATATATKPATPEQAGPLEGAALVNALRRGGHVIAFRHAATDWSQRDLQHVPEQWTSPDPARMRQLSEEGRAQARAIGAAMRGLRIPVRQVVASPYRRTVETAELLGFGPVVTTTDVINMYAADAVGGRARIVTTARERFSTPSLASTNTVIVTHGNVVQAAANVSLEEGGAALFAPGGGGRFTLVALLPPEGWESLALSAVEVPGQPTPGVSPAGGITPVPVCEPTPADDPGPFYRPGAPLRLNVGHGHLLVGTIRSAADCAALPNARIEFWLAGPDGRFDDRHRATVIADAAGAYRFESDFPVAYDETPPHIFVRVEAPRHQALVTRYYPVEDKTAGTFDLILIAENE